MHIKDNMFRSFNHFNLDPANIGNTSANKYEIRFCTLPVLKKPFHIGPYVFHDPSHRRLLCRFYIVGERGIAPSPHIAYSPAIRKNSAGASTATPSALALSSLLPAFSPQTR